MNFAQMDIAPSKICQEQVYDVVIMGAGFAGICQARHLLLNIPNLKIALIDPRSLERSVKDLKIGESTVEITAIFLFKELGLYEYMIENHAPKYGLSFHWPKNPEKTQTPDDYFHIWMNRSPSIDSFHINRAKFEQDVLQMNREMGAEFYNGRVVDVELTPKDELHTVKVKLDQGEIELKAKHLIDTAGRRFIIGKKTDNLIFDPEQLYGINTGSSWLRVKNVDRSIYYDNYRPSNGGASRYYTTNHWFGHGHWIWMLPIDRNEKELSIGVVYHKNIIPLNQINTLDKFTSFLEANQTIVFNIIKSGEIVDFHHLPRLAHNSKKILSEDNWYVLGDAAQMFDPLYSPGLVLAVLGIESTTEVIRAKLNNDADAQQKQEMYNKFLVTNSRSYNQVYRKHEKHLGNASVMSWRIYLENMVWFGVLIPMFVGKWFLDFDFIQKYLSIGDIFFFSKKSFFSQMYEEFDQLVERKINIGMMDYSRIDQLMWGYGPLKHADDYLESEKYEPKHCNVYAGMKTALFFMAMFYIKLRFRAYGVLGVLAPRCSWRIMQLLFFCLLATVGEKIYLFNHRNVPDNTMLEKTKEEFKSYQHEPKLTPWHKQIGV